jgi:hypothetical protein
LFLGIFAAFYADSHVVGEAIAVTIVLVLARIAPMLGRRRFAQWERRFSRLAIHRKQAIFLARLCPCWRLAMLPAIPLPLLWLFRGLRLDPSVSASPVVRACESSSLDMALIKVGDDNDVPQLAAFDPNAH